jgi:hypothetical protein
MSFSKCGAGAEPGLGAPTAQVRSSSGADKRPTIAELTGIMRNQSGRKGKGARTDQSQRIDFSTWVQREPTAFLRRSTIRSGPKLWYQPGVKPGKAGRRGVRYDARDRVRAENVQVPPGPCPGVPRADPRGLAQSGRLALTGNGSQVLWHAFDVLHGGR